jgi:hypothetical protein
MMREARWPACEEMTPKSPSGRSSMLGAVAESILVGLVALRLLQGRLVSIVLNGLAMALVAFCVLTPRSAKFSGKRDACPEYGPAH